MRHYTIGMAGHIDHGKTSLTKALTNVETDRLKEEKERNISIELGYAPLHINETLEVSMIDVPGHERFIRQMIAGVAGIDLVILVVAADEGVMPQTKEHLNILTLLGIDRGIIAITKIDRVDQEMKEIVELDIRDSIEGTFLEQAMFYEVDSLSGIGIDMLMEGITAALEEIPARPIHGSFRLPIDQVFTVPGQGTVVRGTVYEGTVEEGDRLEILPRGDSVRARQLQVHHQQRKSGQAGQRVAINLGGITKESIVRGDVLAAPGHYVATTTIDVALSIVRDLKHSVKQRGEVKLHIGTAEVYGKIVFFDRNELVTEGGEVLCQLRLNHPVVTRRGDRFILRRPTPMETIGGGKVIDAHGEKYRFGQETVAILEKKKEGSPEEILMDALVEKKLLTMKDLAKQTDLPYETIDPIINEMLEQKQLLQLPSNEITSKKVTDSLSSLIRKELERYHHDYSLREGIIKAELIQSYTKTYPKKLTEMVLQFYDFKVNGPFVSLAEFQAHPPKQWEKRIEHALGRLKEEALKVTPLADHFQAQQLPEDLYIDLIHYLTRQQIIFQIDDKHFLHVDPFINAVRELYINTKSHGLFTLQEAKDSTGLSRKYLVPFLEKLDQLELTIRLENERKWRTEHVEKWI
ncbi:selenocysteine-specific translation elongation factor [Bacillus solitudinis]|uniref:selenocysteine-specific translation elongation factor n=1 Tax=Bacillus solitudinis TaxID=2014074 RepID=UPI000C2443E9|nr:selenocysteine-specific translation elongation factor [Bacillus solitudinis]